MEKKFNSREVAQMKRIYQNVDGSLQKVSKLETKIANLEAEKAELQAEIDEMEAPVLRKFGYKSSQMVEKVVVPQMNEDGTPKLDKDGHQVKVVKWVLKYPETIVPVEATYGADYDIDSAQLEANHEETVETPSL